MNENDPNIDLVIDDSLSINDLVRLRNEGFSVMRSAHVGNLSPYNLALASVGIPILSVDHTITGIDKNYFPESINSQTKSETIAPLGRLVCRTVADLPPSRSRIAGDARFLDEVHLNAVRQAMPGTDIFTNTEYVRSNERVVGEVVDIALNDFPEVFERLALPDGKAKQDRNAASLVKSLGVMQLNDDPRQEKTAVIMPNIVDILANFVIESMSSGKEVQYHLSGPDMVRYIGGIMPDLQAMFGRLKASASFREKIPNQIVVKLVPTALARFATTMARRDNMDLALQTLVNTDDALDVLSGERKKFFASSDAGDKQKKNNFVVGVKQQESEAIRPAVDATDRMAEFFIGPGEPGFITQYDVLAEGGLYVPTVNRETSMAGLSRMLGRLTMLKNGKIP